MNIFYLDEDLDRCAEYHVDRHISKMPTEAAQLAASVLWVDKALGFVPRKLTSDELGEVNAASAANKSKPMGDRDYCQYLPSHINHPCSIWARSNTANFEWLFSYGLALGEEYTYRYDRSHQAIERLLKFPAPMHLKTASHIPHSLAMPDEYKSDDPIESYRTYYIRDKAHLASWKRREPPPWWPGDL